VVVHYQARGITRDEVTISINGDDLGAVPADTIDADTRELELVIPPRFVKKGGEPNHLMFDSAKNPPREDAWRIWDLWIEVIPLPDLPPAQLLEVAQKDADTANKLYDMRDVASDNLFKAWKTYRNAWLTLEGVDEKPELYEMTRSQMKTLEPELDKKCHQLLLEAQKQLELKKWKKARQVLDEVNRYFPTREHRCYRLAREKIEENDL
jgi:hypothetical protein